MKNSMLVKISLILTSLILLAISMLVFLKDDPEQISNPIVNALSLEVKNVLNNADRFELLSIEGEDAASERREFGFHGFKILGKTDIADALERKRLLGVLYKGVDEADYIANCFEPRHAIHAVVGDDSVDLVICFECMQIQVFYRTERQHDVLVSRSPATEFNAALTRAGLPLGP